MSKRAPRTRPTIVDVARAAGVSVATVSNAINNRRYVEARTKLRIDAAAARLGYTPNVHARRLRSTGIGTIGLFSSMPFAISSHSSRLGFLMEIASTAAVRALESGYALLLVPSTPAGPPRFDELAIDGAIVLEPSDDDACVAQLLKRGVPLVTIGCQSGAPNALASVDLRSAETAGLLLDHLFDMSCRRVALMIGAARRTSYLETEAVYVERVSAKGVEPLIVRIDESAGEEAAYQNTLVLVRRHRELDGILALVDTFAAGALRALDRLGLDVPATVRLATRYDGRRARESTPPLTSVNLHLEDVAALAVELLLERLRSGRSVGRTVLAPPPTLVVRQSTAAVTRSARGTPTRR